MIQYDRIRFAKELKAKITPIGSPPCDRIEYDIPTGDDKALRLGIHLTKGLVQIAVVADETEFSIQLDQVLHIGIVDFSQEGITEKYIEIGPGSVARTGGNPNVHLTIRILPETHISIQSENDFLESKRQYWDENGAV